VWFRPLDRSLVGGDLLASCNETMEMKVEDLEPVETCVPVVTPGWRTNLLWALIGAILANLLAYPMNAGKDYLYTQLYQDHAQHGHAPALSGNPVRVCPKSQ
jgi:hypothetical protein